MSTAMQVVQVHQPPWGPTDWKTLDLPAELLQKILTLAADEKIQIPSLDGSVVFILNKAWRDFSMHQKRENGGKRGVRILTLPDPSPALLPPSVDLDAGLSFSYIAPSLNPAQVGMKRKGISSDVFDMLDNPSPEALVAAAWLLKELFPQFDGWKFGRANTNDDRRFNTCAYDPVEFDNKSSLVMAVTYTDQGAFDLEQCVIDIPFSVNHNASSLPCLYSREHPCLIYAVPLKEGVSQADYWAKHTSYYKLRQEFGMGKNEARELGLIPTLREERDMGLRRRYNGGQAGHDGGDQPTTQVRMDDNMWVRTLIGSGLPLSDLDRVMSKGSASPLRSLTLPILESTPEPGSKAASILKELQKLTAGKAIARNEKFERIKPLYWAMRNAPTRD